MSFSSTGRDATRRVEGEASPPVSPSMKGVLPIRGVDGSTGDAIPMDATPSLRGADDPYRADVVRWAAMDVPSIMVEEDLTKLREAYRIPADIELILPGPNERACFSMRECTALHLNAFRVFDDPEPDLDVLSVYGIASPLPRCELSQDVVDVLRSIYQADEKTRSYGLILNRHRCLVELGLMASKAEMDQGRCPRPTLAKLTKQRPKTLAPGSAKDTSQRKAIEDLSRSGNKEVAEASKVIEVEDASEMEVPLSRKRKARTAETGTSQVRGSAVEVVDNTICSAPPLQRTLVVNTSGEVVLKGPSRSTSTSRSGDCRPFDSKRRLRELIGAPGARIPDDALRNLPFYPSMEAQAVKKYFTPKWEEFSSHGELEDVLEASLASAIRASTM
ncbi:hypothetical protein Adt_25793 [Abeliophyllum distichum]|uniref:Uncharacterized protein n=1 Tax=Abeliophyllum distichum TaxID=126358 RepID=A0ABD1RP37_9LAMI